jgi:hypothetical protein
MLIVAWPGAARLAATLADKVGTCNTVAHSTNAISLVPLLAKALRSAADVPNT